MLHFELLSPPSAGCALFFMRIESDGEVYERELDLGYTEEYMFEYLDLFLHDVGKRKKAEVDLDLDEETCSFVAIPCEDTWQVQLSVYYNTEEVRVFTVPAYNIFYEFGKIAAIKSWFKDSFEDADMDYSRELKRAWRLHLNNG